MSQHEGRLYDAMSGGDWEAVERLRWSGPTADYAAAYEHYQADHEKPERDRIKAAGAHVKAENADATRQREEAARRAEVRARAEREEAEVLARATSDNRDRPRD